MIEAFKAKSAVLVKASSAGKAWLHEIKFDGCCIVATVHKKWSAGGVERQGRADKFLNYLSPR